MDRNETSKSAPPAAACIPVAQPTEACAAIQINSKSICGRCSFSVSQYIISYILISLINKKRTFGIFVYFLVNKKILDYLLTHAAKSLMLCLSLSQVLLLNLYSF